MWEKIYGVTDFLWGAPLMILMVGVGLYLSIRTGFFQSLQDHLLPCRYERFPGLQRSLRPVFHFETGQKLCRRQGFALRRFVRDRGLCGSGIKHEKEPLFREALFDSC